MARPANPRPVSWYSSRAQRCIALATDGTRCTAITRHLYEYHGENELLPHDSPEPRWVAAPLCDNHKGDCREYNEAEFKRRKKAARAALKPQPPQG